MSDTSRKGDLAAKDDATFTFTIATAVLRKV
jgi:hypothetical protein